MMPDESDLGAAYARSERIVGRRIAGEFVLVPLAGRGADLDSIYNLNRVGAFIWERLDGRRTGREIVTEMTRQFAVDAERAESDYRAFLDKLKSIKAVSAGA